jgi:hypothetical protein
MAHRDRRGYSSFGRPFRLQLSARASDGFDAPASRGRCQAPWGCDRFEWRNGAKYCRDCWLLVTGSAHLPERLMVDEEGGEG